MPIDTTKTVIRYYKEYEALVAIAFGALLQFIYTPAKNMRVAFTIVFSSTFISIYAISPMLDFVKIGQGSKIAISIYALSSLISISLLSLIISLLPKVAKEKVLKYIGVEDVAEKKK